MSGDGRIAPCDRAVFQNGAAICVLDGWAVVIATWVQMVAERSGQAVDWHFSGGRASVLYLGDYAQVRAAVEELLPVLSSPMLRRLSARHRRHGDAKGRRSARPATTGATMLRLYEGPGAHGLYRAGDPLPEGVIGVV